MDPDATLKRLRELVKQFAALGQGAPSPDDVAELCELFGALDEWLYHGGFPPNDWMGGP